MTLSFEQKSDNLAELAVRTGIGLQPGQRLLIRAPIEAAPLVRKITERAYRTGARLVDVIWNDDALTLARFNYAPRDSFEEYPRWRVDGMREIVDGSDALLAILAADPDLLKDQDPDLVALVEKVHRTHTLAVSQQLMRDATNWLVISQPVASWAKKVFPSYGPEQRLAKLWDVFFRVCRADQAEPILAWQRHLNGLAMRRDLLNRKRYTALRFTGPGTALMVGLADNHVWHGGLKETQTGIRFVPNLPTEEVFTMPHRARVEGVVASSKPLSYSGVLIENFKLTFKQGRVVSLAAEKGEAALKRLIEMDKGSSMLGEVALVPDSSPISQSGVLFFNTLFDENAASHLALGRAYRFCIADGPKMSDEEFSAAGGNDSLAHVDFMIGSADMNVDGIDAAGRAEPLMRRGEWAN